MNKPLLSICIPTYNRSKLLSGCLKRIILCPSQEIEIVVSDNASTDSTKEAVKKIGDPRIKYYRNSKNLGYSMNILRMIERSKGDFIFYINDEDYIEPKTIPWILKTIEENRSISYIAGTVVGTRPGYKKIRYNYYKVLNPDQEDRILKPGYESLTKLFFSYSHGSGTILRKQALDLSCVEKYLGTAIEVYMHQILTAQAMVAGSTLCTSKILCYIGKVQQKSRIALFQGRAYSHPLSRYYQLKERIRLIYDIADEKRTQKVLLNRQKKYATLLLASTFRTSFNSFLQMLPLVFDNKELSKSPIFWIGILLIPPRAIVWFLKKMGTKVFCLKTFKK